MTEFEEILDNFSFLDDWEDRYRYVIELGKDMEPLPEQQKVDATKVDGCASQVWIVPSVSGDGPGSIIRFDGDSDALIVKGLIAILRSLLSGRTAAEILTSDPQSDLAQLGLEQHLSSQRSNGLKAMIARVKSIAAHAGGEAA